MIQESADVPQASGNINYLKIIGTLLSRWYWVAFCVLVGVSMAWLYLSIKHFTYRSSASLMLKERSSDVSKILNADGTDNSTIESFNLSQAATFIIQSDAFLNKAVSRLNYRYSFYDKDRWSYEELYPESPFTISILKQDTSVFFSGMFSIVPIGSGAFKLSSNPDDPLAPQRLYHYQDTIHSPGIVFKIVNSFSVRNKTYYFRFHTKESLVSRASRGLEVNAQNLNILEIGMSDSNPYFASNVLNAIADEYIVYESAQRNQSASQRLKFINKQLNALGGKVDSISAELDSVKKKNNITNNLPMKLQADIQRLASYEGQKSTLEIERLNIDQLEQQALANGGKLIINFNLQGQLDGMLASLIGQYNAQLDKRDDALKNYVANSEPLRPIDKKIAELKTAILSNVRQMALRNQDRQQYFQEKIYDARASLDEVPAEAKDYIRFTAEYEINKKILSNFTEEKYKSQIEQAAIEPGASIIYYASPSSIPISPVARRIYMMAILFGGGAGVFFIVLARFLTNKIQDVGTVQLKAHTPILGMIGKAKKAVYYDNEPPIALFKQPESLFSESLRKFRNSFVFIAEKNKGKVVCITSEQSGEGRSFVALNLAGCLSQLNKKVIIIDADLRKPSINKVISTEELGLSAYLVNYKSLLSIIKHTDLKNLDIIPSGVVPANASELLMSVKMKELIHYLRNLYDYILIDTSPIGTFADAIPLVEKADLNLFVLRGGVSGFKAIPLLDKVIAEYHLSNFYIVLNAFKKNPLYQPFDASVNTDIYFNTNYSGYNRKYKAGGDDLKWEHLNKAPR